MNVFFDGVFTRQICKQPKQTTGCGNLWKFSNGDTDDKGLPR